MNDRQHLYAVYQRIRNNCCEGWNSSRDFYEWYEKRLREQKEVCEYCRLPGDTTEYYGKKFREGRRGVSLEVDKRDNKKPYSPDNCGLACYPCNNAKSDVFSYEEFLKIGKAIR